MVQIYFADETVKAEYEKLRESTEFQDLYRFVKRAIDDIKKNPACGISLQKSLIPQKYRKYGIDNLYKYDLPNAWRLLYSVSGKGGIEIIAIILEWCTHKEYERIFGYKAR